MEAALAKHEFSAAEARLLFAYDDQTGHLYWRDRRGPVKAGARAGRVDKRGYWSVGYLGGHYALHRLAWLIYYGVNPGPVVDHINRDPGDNRIANLRDVDHATNAQNRLDARKDSSHGCIGAVYCKKDRAWFAKIEARGKRYHLGSYATAEEASAAYMRAKQTHHAGAVVG